jgi:hypothetical protein
MMRDLRDRTLVCAASSTDFNKSKIFLTFIKDKVPCYVFSVLYVSDMLQMNLLYVIPALFFVSVFWQPITFFPPANSLLLRTHALQQ